MNPQCTEHIEIDFFSDDALLIEMEEIQEAGGGIPTWDRIIGKPFSFIGNSFQVIDNVLLSSTFVYDQAVASNNWIIQHDLNKYPSVTVVDSANSVVVGDVNYLTSNTLEITFHGAFSGKAYLN